MSNKKMVKTDHIVDHGDNIIAFNSGLDESAIKGIEGIAYYRLPEEMKAFYDKVSSIYDVVGFEYDGGFNFGFIVSKKEKKE